ncbi:hypothetical protein WKI65_44195 [Streptomyces sp. MS1.AVA.3]
MTTRKCTDCDTNNDHTAPRCIVCDRPFPRSRVRGTRVSRIRKNLRGNTT